MFGKFKTGNLLSRDFGASPLFVTRGASGLMHRTIPAEPFEPFEPIEPAEPLSHVIKGLHASGANLGKR